MSPHFTLFGIPIRVHGAFWLSALIIGYLGFGRSPLAIAIWVPIMFLGILLHEMGHALMLKRFRVPSEVHLVGMGGLTQYVPGRLTHLRSFLVSFAGPAVGLVLGGLSYAVERFVPLPGIASVALMMWKFVNLGWALFNLLPIVGLDGGHMMLAALDRFFGMRGQRGAFLISVIVACAIVAFALAERDWWIVFLMLQLAVQNYRAWQMQSAWSEGLRDRSRRAEPRRSVPPAAPVEPDLRAAWAALEEGDARTVRRLAESLVSRVREDDDRYQVAHLLAWGKLLTGDPEGALHALRMLPRGKLPDALLEGAILLETGRPAQAVKPLAEAIVDRNDDFVATRLARAVAGSARFDEVIALLSSREKAEAIGARALQIVVNESFYAGHHESAARLGELLFERFGQASDAFNVACSLGRAGRPGDALPWLERAIEAGLADPSVLDTDADLAPVRELPAFRELRERAGLA